MEDPMVLPLRFFAAMDRMRRAWGEVTPCPELSKSQFSTLLTLRHGGREPVNREKRAPFTPTTLAELAGGGGDGAEHARREPAHYPPGSHRVCGAAPG